MIIYIRHAQRGDNELPQLLSSIVHDPPIIPQSEQTIAKSTSQITKILKASNINKIKIISSKFLRCLMTAKRVQQLLKNEGCFEIESQWELNNGIVQFLRPDWFKENPLKNPLIYQDQRQLSKYVRDIKVNQHNYCQPEQTNKQQKGENDQQKQSKVNLKDPKFPQSYVDFHYRTQQFRKQLSKRYPKQGQCIIVFTHGFVVRQFSWKMEHFPDYMKQIRYCGYVISKIINNEEIFMHAKL